MFDDTDSDRNVNIVLPEECRQRTVYIDRYIDDEMANAVAAQLILLFITNPEEDIYLLIKSSGGNFYDGMAIYDLIQSIPSDVVTIGIGKVSGIATLLLAAGSKGKRICLCNSKITVSQTIDFGQKQLPIERLELELKEILHINKKFKNLLSQLTTQSTDQINKDAEYGFSMSADEAKNYGIIDWVFDSNSNLKRVLEAFNKTIH